MKNSKITILMPVYNNSAYIEEAINSAIKQKFKKWNMLISDDRSTDGTVNLLKKIKHKNIIQKKSACKSNLRLSMV